MYEILEYIVHLVVRLSSKFCNRDDARRESSVKRRFDGLGKNSAVSGMVDEKEGSNNSTVEILDGTSIASQSPESVHMLIKTEKPALVPLSTDSTRITDYPISFGSLMVFVVMLSIHPRYPFCNLSCFVLRPYLFVADDSRTFDARCHIQIIS